MDTQENNQGSSQRFGPVVRFPINVRAQMSIDKIPTDPAMIVAGAFVRAGLTPVLEVHYSKRRVDVSTVEIPYLLNEIDGSYHSSSEQKQKDIQFDKFVAFKGHITVRWTNEMAFNHAEAIVDWNIGYNLYRQQAGIEIDIPKLDLISRSYIFNDDQDGKQILN
ncbi:hypothetical protein ACFQ4X_07105 [Fictibacillus halophilus]|uniref:hypothetical protein n=1 Tax=Fictibacillus halophilus TaxID=1610490 RepID=UPI003639BBCD